MIQEIKEHILNVEKAAISTAEDAEQLRIKYLGKKGILPQLFKSFKSVPVEEKKSFGQALNELKQMVESKTIKNKAVKGTNSAQEQLDLTRPGVTNNSGNIHPLSSVKEEIVDIFKRIGFSVSEGPELEDDWHNFSALNFPEEHPARDMQDTFFVEKDPDWALRTHTSSVQVRVMENEKPPIRTISPGRVFRNEAISARAHCIFHQIEGLYIDEGVSFADMKQTILYFAQEFFGKDAKIRLRPSYFPFTEPSAEVDVYWGLENEVDYRITKGTGWLEIMGCGMVDPEVLRSSNIDPEKYSGFAFGMGIERIAMNRYQIPDLRYFFENDIRFLRQFA
ncbi:MAG: phenylalanine--tRNA ligase subunit alpha [Schleiferiaceae bacterium]|nr:phenylalanine--tRNA ligase subunit alpha [Schleiferiaceae bacterium]